MTRRAVVLAAVLLAATVSRAQAPRAQEGTTPPGTLHGVRWPLVSPRDGRPVGQMDVRTLRVRERGAPAEMEGVVARFERSAGDGAEVEAARGVYDGGAGLLTLEGEPVRIRSARYDLSCARLVVDLARRRIRAPGPVQGEVGVPDGRVPDGD
ncbi:MAG: hypothetical protein HY608_00385 [Planctomycetes bacterium]|nr:hypothetical protein [Planctomycetota bacterium]